MFCIGLWQCTRKQVQTVLHAGCAVLCLGCCGLQVQAGSLRKCVGELEPRLPHGMGGSKRMLQSRAQLFSSLLWHNPTVKTPRSVRNQPIHQPSQRLVIKHGFTDQDARTSHHARVIKLQGTCSFPNACMHHHAPAHLPSSDFSLYLYNAVPRSSTNQHTGLEDNSTSVVCVTWLGRA